MALHLSKPYLFNPYTSAMQGISLVYQGYILFSQHWTQLETPAQVPHRRSAHAACCMGDPNTGVVPLMVVGGWGGHNPLSDVWLLDVTNRSWRQVLQCYICYIHGHVCVNVVRMTQLCRMLYCSRAIG